MVWMWTKHQIIKEEFFIYKKISLFLDYVPKVIGNKVNLGQGTEAYVRQVCWNTGTNSKQLTFSRPWVCSETGQDKVCLCFVKFYGFLIIIVIIFFRFSSSIWTRLRQINCQISYRGRCRYVMFLFLFDIFYFAVRNNKSINIFFSWWRWTSHR